MPATAKVRASEPTSDPVLRSSEQSVCLDYVMTKRGIPNTDVAKCWDVDESYVRQIRRNERPLTDEKFQKLPPTLRRLVLTEQSQREGLLVGPAQALSMALQGIHELTVAAFQDLRGECSIDPRLDVVPRPTPAKAGL